ncbi:response regulator transcription factor [Dermatobacter hominis]|uniref:response regulator transcription factor n=1 Tax=Dermatobacter hominis TaxID=2884263 RepID=UPI001D104385|nr:response regulator transcription factor [Dermatobacter hominis]UDY37428.1 response regulator transcription factor [Dermatobacter hominis]
MIRVVLADDQHLVRAGFRVLLSAEPDIDVVGEAADGEGALAVVRETLPDVVLMDIRMPGLDGIAATERIAGDASLDGVRVVVVTTFELDEYVFEALRAGAAGFLVKHTEPAELVRAVRVIAAGDALLSPSVTRTLIGRFAGTPAVGAPAGPADDLLIGTLTDREREVVGLVAQGCSNDEIAARWVVSPATVRTHVSRAMNKLHARDRAQLVVIAYRSGLAAPG